MAEPERPLSPFLHYRWQYTNTLSILHRITGVLLSVAFFVLIYWLGSIAAGPVPYAHATAILGSPPFQLALLGTSIAFSYHLLNGIRHLFWDAGRGFEKSTARASGRSVAVAAVVLGVLTWWLLRGLGGGGA
jgi:succinate dehydrogenase / fumarate reductase cytochrome b subunit